MNYVSGKDANSKSFYLMEGDMVVNAAYDDRCKVIASCKERRVQQALIGIVIRWPKRRHLLSGQALAG